MKKKLIIFTTYIPQVGGIETAMEVLINELDQKKYDITLIYGTAESPVLMFRYAQNADVVRYEWGTQYECDTLLLSSNHNIPPNIKFKKLVQWIHSDYSKYKEPLKNVGVVDEYIAVSKHAGKIVEQMFNVKPTIIYNLIDHNFGREKTHRLKLVTNSRISPEKGFDRMLTFAQGLRDNGIPFRWQIFGDNTFDRQFEIDTKKKFSSFDEVYFMGFHSDVTDGLRECDYLVQFSDFEGCPYAVLEAMKMKVPVILTDFPSAFEMIQEGKNGYIVPLSMEGIDYQKISSEIPVVGEFKLSSAKEWENVL